MEARACFRGAIAWELHLRRYAACVDAAIRTGVVEKGVFSGCGLPRDVSVTVTTSQNAKRANRFSIFDAEIMFAMRHLAGGGSSAAALLRRAPKTTINPLAAISSRRLTTARPAVLSYSFAKSAEPGAALAAATLRLRVRAPAALRCLSTAPGRAEFQIFSDAAILLTDVSSTRVEARPKQIASSKKFSNRPRRGRDRPSRAHNPSLCKPVHAALRRCPTPRTTSRPRRRRCPSTRTRRWA